MVSTEQEAVKDTDTDVRKSARRALDKLDAFAAAAKIAKLREALAPLVKDTRAKEPEDRIKALDHIATFGPDANLVGEHVIEAMRDKVVPVQTAAAAALEKINPKVHPHVVAIFRGPNKRAAILALGELGSEAEIAVPLILSCNDNIFFWGGGNPKAGKYYEDLFPVLAKIAPKDKRFADAVLASVSASNPKRDRTLRERRLAGIAQLNTIDVKTADKVAALVAAVADGEATAQVIKVLEDYGAEAKPALPALKKLKTSPDEAIRNAAITAIAKIE